MSEPLLNVSEIVFGLVLEGKLEPDQIQAQQLAYPYNAAIADVETTNHAGLAMTYGSEAIMAAKSAAKANEQIEPIEWIHELSEAYENSQLEAQMLRTMKKLKRGEEPDLLELTSMLELKMSKNGHGPEIETWADVEAFDRTWLWEPWVPDGELTMITGAQTAGKSALALWIAATLTGGNEKVLWIETENRLSINKERATNWDYDQRKFVNFNVESDLSDTRVWSEIQSMSNRIEDLRLVVVDSLSYGVMDENDTRVKVPIKNLQSLNRRHGVPVVVVHHVRKLRTNEADILTIERVRGSGGITQPFTSIIGIDEPIFADDNRRIHSLKMTMGHEPKPIGFYIKDSGIDWTEAPIPVVSKTQKERASEFLVNILKDGPVDGDEVKRKAEDSGISERTLNDASRDLHIDKTNYSDKGNNVRVWKLP